MQLASSARIPDGLLAAMRLGGEKPHQGLPGRNPALYQGPTVCNSTTALGLRGQAELNRVGSCSTGKERDSESGNDYFEARYYSSSMGRFMSPDWSAKEDPVPYAKLDDPQTLNLYSYVQNNPLIRVDADGHDWGDALDYAMGVAKGVTSSVTFGLVGAPSSHDSTASLSGQLTGSLAVTHISATTLEGSGTAALGGLVAAPETGGTSLAVSAGAGVTALVSSATLAGGAKNVAAVAMSAASKPSSAGKMQKEVEKGQAPKSVDRVDKGRGPHEQDHVHFNDKNESARNQDGSWKHAGTDLSNQVKGWLNKHGWN